MKNKCLLVSSNKRKSLWWRFTSEVAEKTPYDFIVTSLRVERVYHNAFERLGVVWFITNKGTSLPIFKFAKIGKIKINTNIY
ncbi:MAG: hypothetical protein IJ180_08260 [Bacteroidales bacterium]|nr:hypothetical protein [Bacteroidales bacterium]